MSDLEGRLQSWFAAEVDRAEHDLATSRVTTVRQRGRTSVQGLALVGIIVAFVVVAVAARPVIAPNQGSGPDGSPRNSPLPSAEPDPTVDRFTDGIPARIDGEAVIRPEDFAGTQPLGDAAFLIGGWHYGERWFGCGQFEPHPLLDVCSPERIADRPGGAGPILVEARELPDGPIVIRVHTKDPRSATCPEDDRAQCAERLVVDELVWAGDAATNSEPLRIDDVATTLQANRQAIDAGRDIGVQAVVIDRTCLRPMPPVVWRATGTGRLGLVLVYPTVAAREEAERHPPFISGCNGADVLILVTPSAVVENVIVHTQFNKLTSDAERRALADAIAGWLNEPH